MSHCFKRDYINKSTVKKRSILCVGLPAEFMTVNMKEKSKQSQYESVLNQPVFTFLLNIAHSRPFLLDCTTPPHAGST